MGNEEERAMVSASVCWRIYIRTSMHCLGDDVLQLNDGGNKKMKDYESIASDLAKKLIDDALDDKDNKNEETYEYFVNHYALKIDTALRETAEPLEKEREKLIESLEGQVSWDKSLAIEINLCRQEKKALEERVKELQPQYDKALASVKEMYESRIRELEASDNLTAVTAANALCRFHEIRIRELEEALKPFAEYASAPYDGDEPIWFARQCREAKQALSKSRQGEV